MAHKTFPLFKERNAPSLGELKDRLKTKSDLLEKRLYDPLWRLSAKEMAESKTNPVNNLLCGIDLKKNHFIADRGETFKGLYSWARLVDEKPKVEYIGISQNLGKRLRGHVYSNNKSIATWVYMMAKDRYFKSQGITEKSSKDEVKRVYDKFINLCDNAKMLSNNNYDFHLRSDIQKELVDNDYFCTVVLVEDDYELYMLEPYCSLRFESHWNVFQTH